MNTRKNLLLAGLVLGLVAFSLPAVAAADSILDEGNPLEDKSVSFTGKAKFSTLGIGIECEIKTTVTVNGGVIQITAFETPSPEKCTLFGSVNKECVFEKNPVGDDFPVSVDFVTEKETGAPVAVITSGTKNGAHHVITSELKTKAGAPGTCSATTEDLTIVYEENVELKADIETNANGFISALNLTGVVLLDRSAPAAGTTTPAGITVPVGVTGTLLIEKESENTYSYGF